METSIWPVFSVLWLGILTSISPCPLATNIAATMYIGKQIKGPYNVLLSGLSYSLGRSISYIVISIIILKGLLSIPGISNVLQTYMYKFVGPLLIIVGFYLLEIFTFMISLPTLKMDRMKFFANKGITGAFFLGAIFALSFCPVSAALFFGSVIPLSLQHSSNFTLPLFYGIGTAIPVIVLGAVIGFGLSIAGKLINKLTKIEIWLRKITGVLFIVIGVYICLEYFI
ncbi:cytochrome c biogenesis protein [Candidatus Magnetomorum sp. HK-1]|nr:cytochrome c biogenesis protein [Candidatus Magnetomorum sp. HK-1]